MKMSKSEQIIQQRAQSQAVSDSPVVLDKIPRKIIVSKKDNHP